MTSVNLRSDNVAGVAPEVMDAIIAANHGSSPSYGSDPLTDGLNAKFGAVFGCACFVQPVFTGTATNALSLSLLAPGWGAILCSETAHIHDSECGAVELQTGGAKLVPLRQSDGLIKAEVLEEALTQTRWGNTSVAPPKVLSVAQATELGTVYQPGQLAGLADLAHRFGLKFHMDGARFANAVAHLGCPPAEIACDVGIDVLSFGGTKNGCLCAEAVVCFDEALSEEVRYRARKMGQVASKMRFVSAQLHALLEDNRWLKFAGHANAMATRLSTGLSQLQNVELLHRVDANEVFVSMPEAMRSALTSEGFGFYDRGGGHVRMVTAFNTRAEDIDAFIASAARAQERGDQ